MQFQKKTKKTSIIAKNKNLSIQFSLDGFSFCITNADNTNEIILFTQYIFEKTIASPELLLEKIIFFFSDLHEVKTGQVNFMEIKRIIFLI
jgi:hypothetical protein